jgi:ribokinase
MAGIEIVGLGAMNIDRLYRVGQVVVDGEQLVTDSESVPGGSAANTIYGLAKLGVKTGFVGVVGMDEDGGELIEDFETVGVDTSQIRVKQDVKTGSAICFSDKLGRRALYVFPGANNLLSSEDVTLAYLNQAQIVHLSSFANEKQFNLQVDMVKEMSPSIKVSLAPGMIYVGKGLKSLAPLLEKTYIILVNREEIERLTGRDYRTGARECLNLGCQIVVVTLGKGLTTNKDKTATAYIRDAAKEYEIGHKKGSLESQSETTGAGDAFAAGFLFGLLRSKGIEECGLLGDIMAGFAINEVGARKGLPSLAQLSKKYLERSGHQL